MEYYPVNLDIRGRNCLVVGGGSVGTRKVKALIACGGRVTVVSPCGSSDLGDLQNRGRIHWKRREYLSSDVKGMFLVIGATDDESLNRQISVDTQTRGVLCNIADRPELCTFILPAIVSQGDLVIAVSTSGKSPALAKAIRKELETQFGNEYAEFLTLMGQIRKKLLAREHAPEAHKPIFEQLIKSDVIALIRDKKIEDVDGLLHEILGNDFSYAALMPKTR